ncbi:hypothetical protein H6802_03290 [Candidatus Nomurabacteria bacterium]|uniref:Nucleoside 2-deoxyribosyltransferase n=1 Tax=candidate division WWE3 bacterium TaxID=2053526 RepID=A0A955E0J5_UNCKA|nr:hypothetical protein [candidate division WWE3 bacterium]MCB9823955.1 hypothetical protein [Candidatus Nomurabacteria bacterium]MCB9827064.1 hypothetical protein [Candidatus Nomurabacteria bacterium]MCB9827894.1 hypothetical protein [Candidatus Nomurabacteria bacterium]
MTKHTSPKGKIYFSGSLQGIKHKDPNFSYGLVQYMKSNGYDVLSEHVAARTHDEQDDIFLEKTGIDRRNPSTNDPWISAYKIDMDWVDEADYLIAVVDGASHGVGMEIMRALLKEERGLNKTTILCLVHEDNLDKLSWMLRGVPKEYNNFKVSTYKDLESAIKVVCSLLNTH